MTDQPQLMTEEIELIPIHGRLACRAQRADRLRPW